MPTTQGSYAFIKEKLCAMRDAYPSLRRKSDSYVFTALCVKSNFYKNPALVLNESDFADIIVDGQYDGGVVWNVTQNVSFHLVEGMPSNPLIPTVSPIF